MFKFLKKSKFEVVSPASGILKNLSGVPDETFSSKCLGDGFAIEPSTGEVYSPVEGKITMIFETLHAVGLKCNNGIEVLLHIGIDTVSLNGKGFQSFVTIGQQVKAGELLIKFDLETIKSKVPSTDIIVVFTNGETCQLMKDSQKVTNGEMDIVDILQKK
ncbi:PTS glucose transporter subunit IIA [Clostridium frigoris]|uniref:PTS glucose transporter subunit IIA n=1 Tax=Clostridium frigoris TaxID=205327 RepID=A0ABS6BUH7_9CLOT|nr:PTS glucose transporter subunit IIA [Clostridium frigoris]MBU3160477.1 PTS glucose transporter subunit IIA [Clostridium frigoris]